MQRRQQKLIVQQESLSEGQYQNIFDAALDGLIVSVLETGLVLEANPAACKLYGYTRAEFSTLKITDLIHPDSKHVFNEYLQAFQPGIQFEILTKHIRSDKTNFFAECRGSSLLYRGQICLILNFHDVTDRLQTEHILSRSVETRTHEQATLLEISHTLASTLELQPGLILEQLHKIIDFTQGGLFSLKESMLITLAMHGTPQLEQSAPCRILLKNPDVLDSLFNGHQPIRISNIWSEDAEAMRAMLEDSSAMLLENMHSWMWVPLAVKGRIIGGMGVAHTARNYFTAHHGDLALSVANQAAITMVNAELYENAQKLAVLEERQHLARNLHDAVNQSLFSAGLIAEVLPRLWDRDQAEARRSLEDLRRLTRGAQAEMRALLAELRPATLTDSSLGDLLRLLGSAHTVRTNIPVDVKINGEGSVPSETQIVLYRICQEVLTNTAKHAKASRVEVAMEQTAMELNIHIRDNGLGFDPFEMPPSGHYGMEMMHERASKVGVELKITSQRGRGTEVSMHWIESRFYDRINV